MVIMVIGKYIQRCVIILVTTYTYISYLWRSRSLEPHTGYTRGELEDGGSIPGHRSG